MTDDNELDSQNAPSLSRSFANAEEANAAMDAFRKERWEKKKKGLAPHEAAHAIVADDMGNPVKDINIGRGKDQKSSIDWNGLEEQLANVDWNDAADVALIKPKVLDLVTNYVAGHLAEADGLYSNEKKVSDRTTPALLAAGQYGRADLNATCYFLKLIGCNTQENVLAAEDRAREILVRRATHHEALAAKLLEVEFVEGEVLQTLLGH